MICRKCYINYFLYANIVKKGNMTICTNINKKIKEKGNTLY